MKQVLDILEKIIQNSNDSSRVLQLVRELEVLINGNVLANAQAQRQMLQAFLGPAHHVMELHALRNFPDSAVQTLVQQYNQQASK